MGSAVHISSFDERPQKLWDICIQIKQVLDVQLPLHDVDLAHVAQLEASCNLHGVNFSRVASLRMV